MFKNHDGKQSKPPSKIKNILSQKQINSILYSDPFLKAGFISKLVIETEEPILYVDLDLLYSGYAVSGILPQQDNLTLYQPTEDTIAQILTDVLVKASSSQVLVVVDSINGLFNVLNLKKEVGRSVASILMLLASTASHTNSYLVVGSLVRYRKEEGWVLSPTGKRLIETKNSRKLLLEYGKGGITVNVLDGGAKMLLPADALPL